MIALTTDIDWAPDWAIRELVALTQAHGLALTVFVTHDSPAVQELRGQPGIERALHPNYMPGSSHGDTPAAVLEQLTGIVPEAQGVRAHGLWRGTSFVVDYGQRGLAYEASDLLFLQPGIQTGRYWNGVAQLPIWWEDDVHLLHGLSMTFDSLPLDRLPPLAVVNVHPILFALNAQSLQGYQALKAHLGAENRPLTTATRDEVGRFADTGPGGVRELLTQLCGWCAAHPLHGRQTLTEIARELA